MRHSSWLHPRSGVIVQAVAFKVNSSVLQDTANGAPAGDGRQRPDRQAPPVVVSVPPEVTPTAAQVTAMLGQFPQTGFRYKVVQGPGTSLQVAKLTDAGWKVDKPQFTLRTDGLWWSGGKVPTAISVYSGRGKNYLVLTSPGGYGQFLADVYLGEQVSPAKPLSRVWQSRLGEQWVPVNQAAVSWLWFENPVRTFKAIPGLPGYAIAAGVASSIPVSTTASNRVGAMFLRVPGESAGSSTTRRPSCATATRMWFGNELTRPVARRCSARHPERHDRRRGLHRVAQRAGRHARGHRRRRLAGVRQHVQAAHGWGRGVGTISVPSGGFVAFFGGPSGHGVRPSERTPHPRAGRGTNDPVRVSGIGLLRRAEVGVARSMTWWGR